MRFANILGKVVLALIVILTAAGLVSAAYTFEVAKAGNAADYWEYLCGVQLTSFHGHGQYSYYGGTLPEVDGVSYYYDQGHHEQKLFSVATAEILKYAPQVKTLLVSPMPPAGSACLDKWRSVCEIYERAAPRRAACLQEFGGIDPSAISVAQLQALRKAQNADKDEQLRERLHRGKRVWLTLSFEAIYLALWLLFLSWRLFMPSKLTWHWHVGLSPFFLFVPYFFGYAPMTFTSGPSGGFVYPMYLILASLPLHFIPCTSADKVVWESLPNILGSLSQLPGSPLAWSHYACVGPVSSFVAGACLVVITMVPVTLIHKLTRRPK